MKNSPCIYFISQYIVLLFATSIAAHTQVKSIGLPEVVNYTTELTGASAQTWDIIEDRRGYVYFGNEKGVFHFDGETWQLIPLENRSEAHSLALGADQNIYVGGYTEIGVIQRDSFGETHYRNLNNLIPERYRNFSVVWKIYQTRYGIIFQSYEYLFILEEEQMRVVEPETSFGLSYYVNNNYYVVEKGKGLFRFDSEKLEAVSRDPLFTNDEIRLLLPHGSDLLIGSFSNGLYLLKGGALRRWNTPINGEALDNNLYIGSLHGEYYLFGTVKNGVYIADKAGGIVQHLNRSKGLQNNTVLSLFSDSRKNLWLGMDNGIDYLKLSLPLSYIYNNLNIETVYSSIVHNNILYVGTNQGLFMKPLRELSDPMNIAFEMVENTEGQVWYLTNMDGQLLCGHNYGAFRIESNRAIPISETEGIWNFHKPAGQDDILLSGSYGGFVIFEKDARGNWNEVDSINLNKSLRKIAIEENQLAWISHDYEGIYRVKFRQDYRKIEQMTHFADSSGLEGALPYALLNLDNQFFISTSSGNYTFDAPSQKFIASPELNAFFAGLGKISVLETDIRGNVWYIAEKRTGLFRLIEDGSYINVFTPFNQINPILRDDYEQLYIQDAQNIFIATLRGLVHYDPTVIKDYKAPIYTYINRVTVQTKTVDSIISYQGTLGSMSGEESKPVHLKYNWNSVAFEFSCPDLENADHIQYSFRLLGESEKWSEWSPITRKDYNNLGAGEYAFEVRAKNIYNNISSIDRFSFHIQTHFARSTTAIIIYGLFLLLASFVLFIYLKRRFDYVRTSVEEKQTAVFQVKEEQLKEKQEEAQREIEKLKIDNLETSMKHKNKELVNSTYHIIRKNKFLNALKEELSHLSKAAKSELVEQELKKISRKIDRDIINEKNWEVFDRYFDEVHQEFLERLKTKHPDLTPKELRLSAYLRMNISTKEIAPLMNISIRGVEISRYRLRKKLNLERDLNLTQYLMEV